MIETASDGRVRRITLNRPEKRNALNQALCRDLNGALENADREESVGAILLGAHGSSFCAGMDLEEALEGDSGELWG
ncbi:MAG: enoyl-CoA hydratase-related protein, partial [Acidobacteriota bacterium]|nr:enoyl-CoA hydratase-related protein [Acidobacteriota bacterium]